ncbi:MAG: V-type ATP synthase subunit D [Candidatus Omnitrophica bacterium]|nr:V-type ATP synthase subunit D [Candidatus Omnitrophota bacterium]
MIKIQFNKISLITIRKELEIRRGALPILQNKEAALRAETQKIRNRIKMLDEKIEQSFRELAPIERMWNEFPDLVTLKEIRYAKKKAASVMVSIIDGCLFDRAPFSIFGNPSWFLQGIEIMKDMIRLKFERVNEEKILAQVERERRKTTQKVNLYEKVQIPFFEEAIRKIKRYLEDEENLSKASQKILKRRQEAVLQYDGRR